VKARTSHFKQRVFSNNEKPEKEICGDSQGEIPASRRTNHFVEALQIGLQIGPLFEGYVGNANLA
jgi:hypothetical protein